MDIDEAIEILNKEKDDCVLGFEKDRNLKEAVETVLKELEDNQADLTTVYIKGVCDGKSKWRDKIREKIEEKEREIQEFVGTDNTGRFTRDNCRITDEVNVLQELLKESG